MIKYDLFHITIFFVNKDLIDYAQQEVCTRFKG